MDFIVKALIKPGILKNDLDYHLLRASMVVIFLFFGYQKWFDYEAQALLPYIGHGPLIFWMYPVFGVRGATYFLGVAEWLFAGLLFAGYWNKKLGILGALGSCFSFVATTTIIPFMPEGWAASAGGFPAMTERVAFLMKDLVLLAVSVYLLRQDVIRSSLAKMALSNSSTAVLQDARDTGVVTEQLATPIKRTSCDQLPYCTGYSDDSARPVITQADETATLPLASRRSWCIAGRYFCLEALGPGKPPISRHIRNALRKRVDSPAMIHLMVCV